MINSDKVSKERYAFIDLLKFIAIFFVLFYHFSYYNYNFLTDANFSSYLYYYIRAILSCCVPLFFFINGALILNKTFDLKKHVKKLVRIVILTILWALIELIVIMFIKGEYLSLLEIFKGIIQLKHGWINHLWFMGALFTVYIFAPIIKSAFDSPDGKKNFHFFLIAFCLFSFGNSLLSMCINCLEYFMKADILANNNNTFAGFNTIRGVMLYSLSYFMLGGLMFANRNKMLDKHFKIYSIFAIFISMIGLTLYGIMMSNTDEKIFDIVWNGYDSVFTLINVCAFFIITFSYKGDKKLGKYLKIVGENTLGIYIIHILVIELLKPIYTSIAIHNNIIFNIFFVVIILNISLAITLLLKRVPLVKELVKI
jgi:Uncharacterized protein conserved in bacteria